MLTKAGGPTSRWSQSTDLEIGNVSGVDNTGTHDAGFSHTSLPTQYYSRLISITSNKIFSQVQQLLLLV